MTSLSHISLIAFILSQCQNYPTQLHRPPDPGIDEFWVDFNVASQTLAMFVEDPYMGSGNNPEDSMWEYVIIRKDAVKHWMIEG